MNTRTMQLFPFALTCLAACTGEVALTHTTTHGTGGASSMSATSGAGGAVDPNAITGTFLNTWSTDTGDLVVPQDPAMVALSAMVQHSDGGWDTYPGTLDASGNVVIPDVPLGTAYVVVRRAEDWTPIDVLVTDERTLALGSTRPGRLHVAWTSLPTPVTLQIAGAEGWDLSASALRLASRGAGFIKETSCPGGLAGCFPGVSGWTTPLADASQGDRTWLFRYATGVHGRSLTHALESSDFSQQAGVAATLSGAATPVPQAQVALPYDASAFAQALELPTGTAPEVVGVDILEDRPPEAMAWLLGSATDAGLGGGVLDLTYGALFPAGTPLRASFATRYSVPATTTGGEVDVSVPLGAAAPATLRPIVSVPRDVRVNGQPAQAGITGAGQSPTLSWTAPALGAPGAYTLWVSGPPAAPTPGLRIVTRATQVTIPPGLLDDGPRSIQVTASQADAQTGFIGSATASAGSFVP
jgi:hypothetical protein